MSAARESASSAPPSIESNAFKLERSCVAFESLCRSTGIMTAASAPSVPSVASPLLPAPRAPLLALLSVSKGLGGKGGGAGGGREGGPAAPPFRRIGGGPQHSQRRE